MLRWPQTKLDRIINWIYIGLVLLLLSVVMGEQLFGADAVLEIPVRKIGGDNAAAIAHFPNAELLPTQMLRLLHPTFLQRLLNPSGEVLMMPLYALWLLIAIALRLTCFRHFDARAPFTRNTLLGVRIFMWTTLAILLLRGAGHYMFHYEIRTTTGNQYTPDLAVIYMLPEFWAFVLMQRLVVVFRKGYQLTLEQQYTV